MKEQVGSDLERLQVRVITEVGVWQAVYDNSCHVKYFVTCFATPLIQLYLFFIAKATLYCNLYTTLYSAHN